MLNCAGVQLNRCFLNWDHQPACGLDLVSCWFAKHAEQTLLFSAGKLIMKVNCSFYKYGNYSAVCIIDNGWVMLSGHQHGTLVQGLRKHVKTWRFL